MAVDLDQAQLGGSALTEPLLTVLLLGFALTWARMAARSPPRSRSASPC